MLLSHARNRRRWDKRGFYDATLLLSCPSQPLLRLGPCLNCNRIAHTAIVDQLNPSFYTAKSGRLRFAARVAELIVRCQHHEYFHFPSPLFFVLHTPIKSSGRKRSHGNHERRTIGRRYCRYFGVNRPNEWSSSNAWRRSSGLPVAPRRRQ